jgi:hypothetical protein
LNREVEPITLEDTDCSTHKDFELFNFTPKTLIIQFGEYQVCAYALGAPQIVINMADLLN